jgi:hypothetical protein
VILRAVTGGVEVSAIDPVASMQAINNAELHAVAGQVRYLEFLLGILVVLSAGHAVLQTRRGFVD